MKTYRSEFKTRVVIYFVGILAMSALGYSETRNWSSTLKGFIFLASFMSLVVIDEAIFTYLQIDKTKQEIISRSSFFSTKHLRIPNILRISKQPHPIFKALSWSLAVYHRTDSGKENKLEIMPAFSEKTMGRFLADLKSLNPSIQFDKESEEWMEKAQKA